VVWLREPAIERVFDSRLEPVGIVTDSFTARLCEGR
jgi:hypothetical protein